MPTLSEVFAAAKRSRDDKPTKDRTDSGNAHDFEPSISDCIKSRYSELSLSGAQDDPMADLDNFKRPMPVGGSPQANLHHRDPGTAPLAGRMPVAKPAAPRPGGSAPHMQAGQGQAARPAAIAPPQPKSQYAHSPAAPTSTPSAPKTHSHVAPNAGPTAPTPPPSPSGPAGSAPTHSEGHGTPHGGEHLGEGHEGEHPGLEATKELSEDMIGKEVTDFATTVGHTAKVAASNLAGAIGHQKSRLSAAEAGEANPLTSRFTAAVAAHGVSFKGLLKDRKSKMEEEDFKTRYGYVPGFTGRAGSLGGGTSPQHGGAGGGVPNTPHEHAPRSMVNKVLTRTVGPGIANAVAPRGWGGDLGKQKNAQAVVSPLERLQEHASPNQLHQTGSLSSQGTGGGYSQGIHQDSQYQPPGALGKNPFGK